MGIFTSSKLEQPENALSPIEVTEFPIVTEVKLLQLENVDDIISVSLSPISTITNDSHPLKPPLIFLPRYNDFIELFSKLSLSVSTSSLSSIVRDFNLEHPENADLVIDFIFLPIFTISKDLHPLKPLSKFLSRYNDETEQLLKQSFVVSVVLPFSIIRLNAEHPLNALLPIVNTLAGIVTEVRFLQLLNAVFSIPTTLISRLRYDTTFGIITSPE